ncbi:MAG: Fe-S cluster assembly protein SufD [Pirellulales bacterium]|nr:Fe-S cluster assembly protein SufD [Pirellulales bacterium]
MSATLVNTGFTAEAFAAFMAARDEPDWLVDMRSSAFDTFSGLDLPTRSEEEWMRTDIRLLKLDRYALTANSPSDSAAPEALLAAGVELAGRSVSVNSQPVEGGLAEKWAKQGVLFGSLDALVESHANRIRPYFERQLIRTDQDKFSALNAAFWSGGTLLLVPRGVQVDQPLHSLSVMTDGGIDLGKTLVILEEGAEATFMAETASSAVGDGGLHCGSIELIAEKGARLRYVNLQNWGSQVWHFAQQMGHVGEKANLQWTIGALGSRLAKVNQHVALTGQDAEAQVNGVIFSQGKQHLCYNTHQHHMAPFCQSDLLYKGALQDHSRSVWRGMIKVDNVAQRTNAYQRNDNLMLTASARADSIPGLEIEADDVRCTHGSTSGRVDDAQLFYAMTRGYTRQEAVRMIVNGFFQQVFDRITIESVREALGEAIGQRVRDL